MYTCEDGHDSESGDYCDVCGRPISATSGQPSEPPAPAPDVESRSAAQPCEKCGASLAGRFCESCGHDSMVPVREPLPEPQPEPGTEPDSVSGSWFAVVFADREWYEVTSRRGGPDAGSVQFPWHCPQRRFTLSGTRITIGRRSRSRGTEPDIDLSGPPLDPGVSAQHARLLLTEDGGWEIVDLESTNGTAVGDAPDPITPGVAVPIADGDRIRLGAWTTLRITSAPET